MYIDIYILLFYIPAMVKSENSRKFRKDRGLIRRHSPETRPSPCPEMRHFLWPHWQQIIGRIVYLVIIVINHWNIYGE